MAMRICTNFIWLSSIFSFVNFLFRKNENEKVEERKDIELKDIESKEGKK